MTINDSFSIFLDVLFPLILAAGAGALADRFLNFDLLSINRLALYIFAPALIFSSLMKVQVTIDESFRVFLFVLFVTLGMALIGWLYAYFSRLDGPTTSSVVLSVTTANSVNFGFPLLLFAFGNEAVQLGAILVAFNSIGFNILGILFLTTRAPLPRPGTLRVLWRMPILYAIVLAVLFRLFGLDIPEFIFQPISRLGSAGIPVLLVAAGMEIGRSGLGNLNKDVWNTVALRLLIAPLIAWNVSSLVGLTGLLKSVSILLASMPTAIFPIAYAREFNSDTEFFSKTVLISTLCGMITLQIVLSLLTS